MSLFWFEERSSIPLQHSIEVENALYALPSIIDAAAVSVPDRRLGELVAAVVATKPSYHGTITEADVIKGVKSMLPAYAVPVLVLVQSEPLGESR